MLPLASPACTPCSAFSHLQTATSVARLRRVVLSTWAFLAAEGGLVVPLLAACLLHLLRAAAVERFNLFSVFLFVPRAAAIALARQG